MNRTRLIAICVFRNRSRILVARGTDDVTGERFYRPLGGEIEFGELAAEALRREIREELGQEIEEPVRLGVLENRFTYRGKPGHEVVFVYDAQFVDAALYAREEIAIAEPVWDGPAIWVHLDAALDTPLYPAGLAALLDDGR